MKRTIITLLTCALLVCSGCAGSVEAQSSAATDAQTDSAETIYGKIKEINGNELLLVLGTYQTANRQRGETPDGEDAPSSPPDMDSSENTPAFGADGPQGEGPGPGEGGQRMGGRNRDASATEAADGDEATPPSGSGPPQGSGGSRPDRPNRDGSEAGDSGAPGDGTASGSFGQGGGGFVSNGQEQTYLIPVTTPITTGQGDNSREIRFTQLAVKNIVCLNLDAAGAILSIQVLS